MLEEAPRVDSAVWQLTQHLDDEAPGAEQLPRMDRLLMEWLGLDGDEATEASIADSIAQLRRAGDDRARGRLALLLRTMAFVRQKQAAAPAEDDDNWYSPAALDAAAVRGADAALPFADEDVSILRSLIRSRPTPARRILLAHGLDELRKHLQTLDRYNEALAAAQEAVEEIKAVSAAGYPMLEELTTFHLNVDHCLRQLARPNEAVEAAQQAVTAAVQQRQLTGQRSHLRTLRLSLKHLVISLEQAKRFTEAVPAAREIVALVRHDITAHPPSERDAFNRDNELADALGDLAYNAGKTGDHAQAVAAATERVGLLRSVLATHQRPEHAARLANGLGDLANALDRGGRLPEALQAASEAIIRYRELATTDQLDRSDRSSFALVVWQVYDQLTDAGEHSKALAAARERTAIEQELAVCDPDTHFDRYLAALDDLAQALTRVGVHHEAAAVRATAHQARTTRTVTTTSVPAVPRQLTGVTVGSIPAASHAELVHRLLTEWSEIERRVPTEHQGDRLTWLSANLGTTVRTLDRVRRVRNRAAHDAGGEVSTAELVEALAVLHSIRPGPG